MENREIVSTPVPDDPLRQWKSDDYEPPVTSNGPLADDKTASPPYDIGDTPPSVPPPPARK